MRWSDWPGGETRSIVDPVNRLPRPWQTPLGPFRAFLWRGVSMNSDQLAAHLRVDRYGDFVLTDAIRPAPHVPVTPREGFRLDLFSDDRAGLTVPVLAASVSREKLFDLFLDLLDPLGEVVDLMLETSHASKGAGHHDLFREHIDLPVLQSTFLDFEDLLLNDGSPARPSSPRPGRWKCNSTSTNCWWLLAQPGAVRAHPAPTWRGPRRRPETHHRRRTPAQHRPAPRG